MGGNGQGEQCLPSSGVALIGISVTVKSPQVLPLALPPRWGRDGEGETLQDTCVFMHRGDTGVMKG